MKTSQLALFACIARYMRWLRYRFFLRFYLYLVGISVMATTFLFIDIHNARMISGAELFTKAASHTVVQHQREPMPVIIRWFDSGDTREYDITCKSLHCHVTTRHAEYHNHDILGLMFYGTTFGTVGLPLPRKPGHLWSMMHEESPNNNDWLFSTKDAMSLFNLTATFQRTSHYSFPTMWLTDERDITSTEFMVSVQEKNQLRREGLAPIVFVHRDCQTPSDRSHYFHMLRKHIQIDSYGVCEHNKDFPNRSQTSNDFFKLIAKYKFAFAFENAVCEDYITEKFWRPLHLGVVPLVFGSPKIKEFIPSSYSIIDIRDFRSVKEVADYITFLDTHDVEYAKYLDFKRTGITNEKLKLHLHQREFGHGKPYKNFDGGFECFLCEKLHKYKHQVASGQPIEPWQGKYEHYACPVPKLFDEEGRYVSESKTWPLVQSYAEKYLQSLRFHIDNNINSDSEAIRKYAKYLQNQQRTLRHA